MRIKIITFLIAMLPGVATAQDYTVWLERCEPYREQVERILASEGVSTDYYYLMVAESKCTPKAKSHAGARGFWQLMPSTAKHFGCFHLDDVECSTRAAAKYILSLEKRFNSFKEVIAAWNMGGHNYSRIGRKSAEAIGLIQRTRAIMQNDKGIRKMIRLSAEFLFMCAVSAIRPTVFISDTGECVAMCDAGSDSPHRCYDDTGEPLTDCFSRSGTEQLCDAYIQRVTAEDYQWTP